MSIGNGGGTSISGSKYDANGQYDLQTIYNGNYAGPFSIDPSYSETERKSGNYIKSSINNHYWYGGLSTFNFQKSDKIVVSGGLDMRYYKGEHYREIYDLLGGDYAIVADDRTQFSSVKREGDKIGYHNDGIVKWAGVFYQIEHKDNFISTFLNISASNSAYKRIDYFRKKDLVLPDTTIREALGTHLYFGEYISDTVTVNGVDYTVNSREAVAASTDWKWIIGLTVKSGSNINLDDRNNIFFKVGYISKAPRFTNIYFYDNSLFRDIKNEEVKAAELGYSYRSSIFSANLNSYYTIWENKPANGGVSILIDDETYRGNMNGMNALHQGVEVDFAYRVLHNLSLEGLVSLGDWRWTSSDTVRFLDDNNNPVIDEEGGGNCSL